MRDRNSFPNNSLLFFYKKLIPIFFENSGYPYVIMHWINCLQSIPLYIFEILIVVNTFNIFSNV